jgi:hypothetical protein
MKALERGGQGLGRGEHHAERRRRHPTVRLLGVGLLLIAGALSGCASLATQAALGPAPRADLPQVVDYEWAGRRSDELIVVYEVWAARPARVETRWVVIDLRAVAWSPGLEAPRVGALDAQPAPVPDPRSVERLLMSEWPERLKGEAPRMAQPTPRPGIEDVSVYARRGTSPEVLVVVTHPTGATRSASWALRMDDAGAAPEPLTRAAARLVAAPVAAAVDLATAPLQLGLGFLGIVRLH